jgi:hypothetical protein
MSKREQRHGLIILILFCVLMLIAGWIDPCGDGGCTAAERAASYGK